MTCTGGRLASFAISLRGRHIDANLMTSVNNVFPDALIDMRDCQLDLAAVRAIGHINQAHVLILDRGGLDYHELVNASMKKYASEHSSPGSRR